jgi:16S rRNA (guanine966-N2)-methyltransferase
VGDLFAGSGALGIEALSRGARSCVFVERAHDSLRVLRANLAALGLEARSRVVEGRAEEYVRRAADCFDIILADPPYAFDAREDLVDDIVTSSLLAPEGVLVFEHAADAVLTARIGWRCTDRRAFGTTAVTFIRHTAMEEPR